MYTWIEPLFDKSRSQISRCPECGHVGSRRFLSLFIVTGPSGTGKTAVVSELQRLLPDWEVFETDILWDSGHDWNMIKANWLRIADNLAQRPHGRLTILCGTMQPEDIVKVILAPVLAPSTGYLWFVIRRYYGNVCVRVRRGVDAMKNLFYSSKSIWSG